MKIYIFIIITVFSFTNFFCAGMQISADDVNKELRSTAASIKNDRSSVYKLDDKIIGRNGYYYILKNDGRIAYHPKKALINYDFSGFPFVKKILKNRNGCISSSADRVQRYIFFTEIDPSEILCLTIENDEFSEPVYECTPDIEDKK